MRGDESRSDVLLLTNRCFYKFFQPPARAFHRFTPAALHVGHIHLPLIFFVGFKPTQLK